MKIRNLSDKGVVKKQFRMGGICLAVDHGDPKGFPVRKPAQLGSFDGNGPTHISETEDNQVNTAFVIGRNSLLIKRQALHQQ